MNNYLQIMAKILRCFLCSYFVCSWALASVGLCTHCMMCCYTTWITLVYPLSTCFSFIHPFVLLWRHVNKTEKWSRMGRKGWNNGCSCCQCHGFLGDFNAIKRQNFTSIDKRGWSWWVVSDKWCQCICSYRYFFT